MTILAPSATNISAVRSPMPLVAPVITATLPSSRPMSFSLFWRSCSKYPEPAGTKQATLYRDGSKIMRLLKRPAPNYAFCSMLGLILDRLIGLKWHMGKWINEFRRGWQGISQPSPLLGIGFAAFCLALSTLPGGGFR